jgi:DNA repair exonuclease SbcCD ATPase subunit
MMINNQGFSSAVLDQAREMDRNGVGLPVVEMLAKAFLLRGGSDTLNSRLSVVQNQKALVDCEKANLEAKIKALDYEIESTATEESRLKDQLKEVNGDTPSYTAGTEKLANLQSEVKESHNTMADKVKQIEEVTKRLMTAGAEEKELLEKQLKEMEEEMEELAVKVKEMAEQKAIEIKHATAEALEELWEKIQEEIEYVKNTEAFKAMEAKAQMAYDKLTDPAFHQELMDMATHAAEQAKELALEAKDMIEDPELIDKANAALAKAKEKAEELAAAAQDPEKYAQLQEAAKQAFEEAKAEAKKVADAVKDPEFQKKLQDAQDQALAKVETVRKAAIEVANDPEIQKKLQETGMA